MPPQVNATVTLVREGTAASGARDDWDNPGVEPAGGGGTKWEGELDAYYREKVDRVVDAGKVNIFTRRTLHVDTAAFRAVELDENDVITFTAGGREQTGRAAAIAIAELDDPDLADVATTRIDLEPA